MNVFKFATINEGYISLVRNLVQNPDYHKVVKLSGSGKGVLINKKSRVHLRNVHIMFENPAEFKVADPRRSEIMNEYMIKERALFDEGIIDANRMGTISKVWKGIANPDQTINANYGYMVYHLKDAGNSKFDPIMMSQFEWCQDRLVRNPHTLQAIMHFNRPKDQYQGNLDQPCTVFAQFTVEQNKLNFHSYMRSNDVIYGTPYNLAYFKILQQRMCDWLNTNHHLNLSMGYLHHNTTSLHLYDDKISIASQIIGDN